jgi:uncharacterized protein (DUF1800 family)
MRNRASSLRRHFAAVVCASLAVLGGGLSAASAAIQKSPGLYTTVVNGTPTTRAVALESVSLVGEPFSLNMETNFSPNDPRTRITLFGTDFEFLQGEGANALSADAQDGTGAIYPLRVEYVGAVPSFPGVYMVVLRLNDSMTSNLGDVLVRVNLHGMASNRVRVAIGQVGGGPADVSPPNPAPASPPGAPTLLSLAQYQAQYTNPSFPGDADIVRFLEQASWGPKGDGTDFARVRQIGMKAYIDEQFNTAPLFIDNAANPPVFSNYPVMPLWPVNVPTNPPCDNTCLRDNYTLYQLQKQFMVNALTGNDQLRQRVSLALHEMIVVSGRDLNNNEASWYAPYLQTIDRNAFGNFRTLLFEMTLNPGMGRYLDMAGNSRVAPNENYARELMQLFSIGTDMLNPDGTPILDANGNRVPTYGQTEITNFARVFTGWIIPTKTVTINGVSGISVLDYITPMAFSNNTGANGPFDIGAKTLLNGQNLPACSNCTGNATNMAAYKNAELNAAIDNIFNHQNTGPYLCGQLIHHLVTSNPSPAYVGRCAATFANNGSGVRGDMKVIITTILLDPEARGDAKTDSNYGKLREPVQLMTNLLRGFNATSDGVLVANSIFLTPNVGSFSTALGQDVFNPPTVFSYFPADYGLPGASLFAPEFGILDTSTSYQRANFVNTLFLANSGNGIAASSPNRPTGTQTNYSAYQAMANGCTAGTCQLVDTLNTNLMHGTMSSSMRTGIVNAIVAITNADQTTQARQRTQTAIYLVSTSSQYQVQR